MCKRAALTVLLILITGSLFAADEAAKLATADQAVIDRVIASSLSDAHRARDAYTAAVNKAQEKGVKDLERVKADAMRSANLPLANAADAKIKSLKDGALFEMMGEKSKPPKLQDTLKSIAGTWKHTDGTNNTVVINADATCKFNSKLKGKVIEAGGAIVLIWENEVVYIFLNCSPDKIELINNGNKRSDLERVR